MYIKYEGQFCTLSMFYFLLPYEQSKKTKKSKFPYECVTYKLYYVHLAVSHCNNLDVKPSHFPDTPTPYVFYTQYLLLRNVSFSSNMRRKVHQVESGIRVDLYYFLTAICLVIYGNFVVFVVGRRVLRTLQSTNTCPENRMHLKCQLIIKQLIFIV